MADVRRAVREWAGEQPAGAGSYLVALSGGGDSLALAWALSQEAPGLNLPMGAVVVDHQLQQGSTERAHIAADVATGFGLAPVIIKQVDVGTTGGPEEAARNARYQAFSEALKETGARGVLLAHTKDDQAETVLLGLARGSGPSGLKGMAVRDGSLHRPLLNLSRATLRQALTDAGVTWWEDPHNEDDRFTRSRVRRQVLPVLENQLGPGVVDSLARTAALFRQDSDALDSFAREFVAHNVESSTPHTQSISVASLSEQKPAVSSRALRMMVMGVGGGPPSFAQMEQIQGLIGAWRGQLVIDVSGATLERVDGRIVVKARAENVKRGLRRGL